MQPTLGGRHVGHLMLDHRGMNVRGPDDQIDRSISCLTLTGRRPSRSPLRGNGAYYRPKAHPRQPILSPGVTPMEKQADGSIR